MKYLLIIGHDTFFRPTKPLISNIRHWIKKMEKCGKRVYGNPLRPSDEASTVRVRKGNLIVKNGPSTRTKEKIAAYELIECSSMKEAIEIASGHPMAKAATIEVRPVWEELAD